METEDGPTPEWLSDISSKKGELWLILAKNFDLHLRQFLCSPERSVLVDLPPWPKKKRETTNKVHVAST